MTDLEHEDSKVCQTNQCCPCQQCAEHGPGGDSLLSEQVLKQVVATHEVGRPTDREALGVEDLIKIAVKGVLGGCDV